ncbi:unnamed protein product [Candidula unifasciata]|uniref:DDB1- and CUL4-associated factor 5 n=1 Tax=Candidula unifasciata TaxID=100452 RepID=A0A8S4A246_9EUPU|nr:unnamed protein product [Candidula unifasciata]
MEPARRRFMSTPLGVRERERSGTSLVRLKETLFGRRLAVSQSLYKRDLRGHFGCVNAIEFSTDGELIASGGDDRRLLLWNIGQTIFDDKAPQVIDTLHVSNINTCCFDAGNKTVSTGGNDGQVIVHDINMRQSTAVYGLSDAVYCLSADPVNATIIATATDDGKAHLIDFRMSIDTAPFVLADLSTAMHSIMFNPAEPRLLATANSKHGIGLWDVRMPLKCLQYKSNVQNCMSVRFNSRGDQLLALRRRSSPVLFDIAKLHPIYEFDYKTYYNACTLKSCSFAGLKDEYVMSGSDDFCVYLWKIPSDISENYIQSQPHMILKGHRSIVNQVRYCSHNQTIISSGVEKLIKMWSPYYIPGCTGHLTHSRRYGDDDEIERNAYSHEEYIHMVLQAGSFLSHDYTNGSMEEEPCMIAFFDSLIQREVEQTVQGEDAEVQESDDDLTGHDAGSDGDQREAERPGRIRSPIDGDQRTADTPGKVRPPGDVVSDREEVNSSTASESEDASNTRDTSLSSSSRLEDSSRPFFMDLESSSDSEGEVDVILSAMYTRYMSARERALNSNLRPTGKKISSVIAKGKQRDRSLQKQARTRKRQRIRKNITSLSILADVIDTFVDNLVSTEPSNSRTLSDTNDGHLSTDSDSDNSSTPVEVIHQTMTLYTDDTSSVTAVPALSRPATTNDSAVDMPVVPLGLESGMYFMPELQAFAPESFNAVANLANLPGPSRSGNFRRNNTPLDTSSHNHRRRLRSKPPSETSHGHTLNSSAPRSAAGDPVSNGCSSSGRCCSSSGRCCSSSGRCCNNRNSSSSGGHQFSSNERSSSCPTDLVPTQVGPASRHTGWEVSSDLVDASRQGADRQHMRVSSTMTDDTGLLGETSQHMSASLTMTDDTWLLGETSQHNQCPSSSSSFITAAGSHHLGPWWSSARTARTSTDVSSRTSTDVSSRTSTDASSRTSTDASSRTSMDASSRTSTDASSRTSTAVSSRTSRDASSRTSTDASSRTSTDASSRTFRDASSRTSTDANCNKPVKIQFKRAKVVGRRFRVHRCEPNSSSDEDK